MSRTAARPPQLLQRAATVTLNPRIPLWGSHLFSLPHALLAVYHARRREAKSLLESGMQDNKHASGLAGARRGRSESDGLSCGRRGAASVLRTGRRLSHADPRLWFEVWAVSSGEGTNEGHANTVIIITPAERSRWRLPTVEKLDSELTTFEVLIHVSSIEAGKSSLPLMNSGCCKRNHFSL